MRKPVTGSDIAASNRLVEDDEFGLITNPRMPDPEYGAGQASAILSLLAKVSHQSQNVSVIDEYADRDTAAVAVCEEPLKVAHFDNDGTGPAFERVGEPV